MSSHNPYSAEVMTISKQLCDQCLTLLYLPTYKMRIFFPIQHLKNGGPHRTIQKV